MSYITLDNLKLFATGLSEKITEFFVKKEAGKGLSSNDYTTAEKEKLEGIEAGANHYVHSDSGVTAGTYRSVTVDTQGHILEGSNPTTLSGYGITDAAAKKHTHGSGDITGIDASKITSGTISIDRIPAAALERCKVVADETARFNLTIDIVQNGETVKEADTKRMFLVKDDTKLSTEEGYEEFTVGSAASVPWSGVTGKPSSYKPSTHQHTAAQISDLTEATEAEIDNIISGIFQ